MADEEGWVRKTLRRNEDGLLRLARELDRKGYVKGPEAADLVRIQRGTT